MKAFTGCRNLTHCAGRTSSRGIATNPYIAEGLTGRTKINEHLYWHASNRNGPDWVTDYLSAHPALMNLAMTRLEQRWEGRQ